jgi:hypothetical protein
MNIQDVNHMRVWTDSSVSGHGTMAVCFENGDETSGSMMAGNVLMSKSET